MPPEHDLFAAQFEALNAHCRDLKPLAAEIEERFLSIGTSLEKLPAASDGLVKQSEELLRLALGQGQGTSILESTVASLQGPLSFVDHYGDTSRELLKQLHSSITQIDTMLRHEADFERIVGPLKFIRTLFKVESSGLDHTLQSMFLALTEDINDLQRQVSETFGEKFQILRDSQRTIIAVVRNLESQARTRDRIVREKRRAMEQVLADLKNDLERNQAKDVKLTQVSKAISGEVANLVFGLQAQDIVSQKIAHVTSALEQMQKEFVSYQLAPDADSQGKRLHYFAQAARVEQAQLLAIRADLEQTEGRLLSAVESIEREIGKLDDDCISLGEFDRVTAGVDGLVQVLLDTIDEVRGLVQTTVASAGATFEAIQPIGGKTSNVTATMRTLSAHIRLIALNAQVQAAQIENGAGLEVLAAATASVADETGRISEEIAGQLDQLGVEMDRLVHSFAGLRGRGEEIQSDWNGQGQADEKRLHEFRDATLVVLQTIAESSENIRGLAGGMKEKLNLKSIADARIQRPHDLLEQLGRLSRELLALPKFEKVKPPSGGFTQNYTMESERLVHQAALATVAGSELPAAAGDSVLFDSECTEVSQAGTSPNLPDVAKPEVAAAGSLTGLAATNGENASGESKKEFGDNVDLF